MTEQIVLPEGQESFKLNEVCKLANVQPYMLRFWGQEFPQLEAEKSGTGQRLFRKDQVELTLEIKHLLFDEGLTIAGARKRLDNQNGGSKAVAVASPVEKELPPAEEKEKPKKKRQSKKSPQPEAAEKGSEDQKVDKPPVENVQPLLTTLRDVRAELAEVVAEMKIE